MKTIPLQTATKNHRALIQDQMARVSSKQLFKNLIDLPY